MFGTGSVLNVNCLMLFLGTLAKRNEKMNEILEIFKRSQKVVLVIISLWLIKVRSESISLLTSDHSWIKRKLFKSVI